MTSHFPIHGLALMKNPLLLLLLLALPCFSGEAPRPNILYFYVDDMGWGSIGPNAQAERKAKGLPTVKTPNLNKLAAEGINFTRSYGCTVCSPSRSSQQTGFHQGHTFADRNDPDNAKKAIRADDITMGDALSAAGYTTGYWGKWGYGGSKDMENPTIDNVQTLPTSHGYQHVLAELHHVRAHTFYQPTLWHSPAPKGSKGGLHLIPNSMAKYVGNKDYPEQPSNHNHPDYPTPAYCDDLYCFQALDFVRNGAKAYNANQTPFFGILGVQIPHAPFHEIEKLPDWDIAYKDDPHFAQLSPQSRQWATMVTRIDAHFGNILAALEDPNGDGDTSDSVADNTLVIFQSDNGGPSGSSNNEFDANGGLRGNKGSIYEGGIRVPTIMRWSAKIHCSSKLKPGTDSHKVIDITDLLPTFCELAGAEIPVGIDGVSIAPTLSGEGYQRPRDFLIHEAGKAASIIRGNQKLIRLKKGGHELYDLEKDPAETTNLTDQNPALVQELEEIMIAERVDEPKGFAVTYHEWIGDKDFSNLKDANSPEHWSDYSYINEGINYMSEDGAPKASWIGHTNRNHKDNLGPKVTTKIEFLGLEIHTPNNFFNNVFVYGGEPHGHIIGRNEIRIKGFVRLYGGTLTSNRWVEVYPRGRLSGSGIINGHLINAGSLEVINLDKMYVKGDYTSTASSIISSIFDDPIPDIQIHGHAQLNGELSYNLKPKLEIGTTITILQAKSIEGRFSKVTFVSDYDDILKYDIRYTKESVTFTVLEK